MESIPTLFFVICTYRLLIMRLTLGFKYFVVCPLMMVRYTVEKPNHEKEKFVAAYVHFQFYPYPKSNTS